MTTARRFSVTEGRIRGPITLLACLVPWFVISHSASGIQLTAWDFSGNTAVEAGAASANATTVAPGFQTTAITRGGPGHDTTDPLPGSFWNGAWPSNPRDNYFEFSINPQPGTTYSISSIDFGLVAEVLADLVNHGSFLRGPESWVLTSYINGVESDLDTWPAPTGLTTTYSSHSSLLPASFQNLDSARTFRLYGFNTSGGGGGITSLSINGTVSVPETLPFGAFGLAVTVLLFVRSRIKD